MTIPAGTPNYARVLSEQVPRDRRTCDDYVWRTNTGRCIGRMGHQGQDASCSDCPSRQLSDVKP